MVWVHLRKDRFPPGKFGKLKPRVDGPFKIIEKIGENAYKLQLPDEYEISPMFNVKDLRAYHGEDLRASPGLGLGFGGGDSSRDVGGCLFSCFAVLDCCWLFWAVAFPSVFRGGSVRFSVILGLGSCILWLCGFAFWK